MKKIFKNQTSNTPIFVIDSSLNGKVNQAKLEETLQQKRRMLSASLKKDKAVQ